jgi:acyl-homoserine lactone acylase PvdQ
MPRAFVVLGALLLTPLLASAQRTAPGARIRVTSFAGSPREGQLLEWRGDSALIQTRGSSDSVLIRPDHMGIIEVFAGTRTHVAGGAMIGAGLGFATGIAMGLAMANDDFFQLDTGDVLALGGVSAALGAGVGALWGLVLKQSAWAPIEAGAVQVRGDLEPHRVGLSFRVGF